MDNYRTSSLFHFTNKKNNLKNILTEGVKPNYAKETLLDESIVGIPMVSMCDIPISRTKTILRYGSYAIGFTKEWGIKNGFNPIHYIQGNRFEKSHLDLIEINNYSFQRTNEATVKHENQSVFLPQNQSSNGDNFLLFYKIYNLNLTSLAYSKPYSGVNKEGHPIVKYDENEWRYITPFQTPNNWLWGIDEYTNWRGDVKKTKPKSVFEPLKFTVNDISFILLQFENQIPDLINFISKLNSLAGGMINEDEKKILMSKIISFERIKKDF